MAENLVELEKSPLRSSPKVDLSPLVSPVITTPTKLTPTKLLNDINWLNLDEQLKVRLLFYVPQF